MAADSLAPGHVPVLFDARAWADDMSRASEGGRVAAEEARRDAERAGMEVGRLRPCVSEGLDGTRLTGCMKIYVPWPTGRFGMILRIVRQGDRLLLSYLAFGVRHHPKDARAPTVYALAHRRLHGRWP